MNFKLIKETHTQIQSIWIFVIEGKPDSAIRTTVFLTPTSGAQIFVNIDSSSDKEYLTYDYGIHLADCVFDLFRTNWELLSDANDDQVLDDMIDDEEAKMEEFLNYLRHLQKLFLSRIDSFTDWQ